MSDERPADRVVADAAIARFVDSFVIESKRARAMLKLLDRKGRGSISTIQALEGWLDPETWRELDRNWRFPEGLGNPAGILIEEGFPRRTTLTEALRSVEGRFGGLFIPDGVSFAVLFRELGPPLVCRK